MTSPLSVGVALKRVDRWTRVDPLSGAVASDGRSSGCSDADLAALEWALRLATAWGGQVLAATAGPAPAEAVLRQALAAGANRAVRIEADPEAASSAVARALAGVLEGCAVVLCGDWSLDRGSGSVPAFLAAELGAAQALGLVELAVDPDQPGQVVAGRRVGGGARERLRARPPSVLSVEGGTARLRRASLPAVLAARRVGVEVVVPSPAVGPARPPARVGPYRPRPQALAGPDPRLPARERVAALAGGTGSARSGRELATTAPPAAADRLLSALRAWGELP